MYINVIFVKDCIKSKRAKKMMNKDEEYYCYIMLLWFLRDDIFGPAILSHREKLSAELNNLIDKIESVRR